MTKLDLLCLVLEGLEEISQVIQKIIERVIQSLNEERIRQVQPLKQE